MPDTLPFDQSLALVTGAGRGIGRAIACALHAAGAHVILCSRTQQELDALASDLLKQGGQVTTMVADLSNLDEIGQLYQKIDEIGPLDILINNAGIGRFARVEDVTPQEFDAVLHLNLRGAFFCAQQAYRRMQEHGGGRIIQVGSVVSVKGYPEQAVYAGSKHALLGMSKVMAAEGQEYGIIVQAVLPGGVDTDLIDDARPDLDRTVLMHPDDIAEAVMFLLRQQGNAITDSMQIRRRASKPFA